MWYVFYDRAREIAAERSAEAARERLLRTGRPASSRTWFSGVRRTGAVVAAGIARRLDECVAREQLGLPG
jgi:hypothetical protein